MILSRSDYPCQLSNITFEYIINEMNRTLGYIYQESDCYVWFVNGDAANINMHAKKFIWKGKKVKVFLW